MTTARAVVAVIAIASGLAACQPRDQPAIEEAQAAMLVDREQQLASRIAAGGGTAPGAPVAIWVLPPELLEVSGIALTADGRLLAHDDQIGTVYVIDPRRGVVLKKFSLGENGVRADFEGIAVGPSSIFMVTSNGRLYEFREGADGERVPYTMHNTRLGKECEFEGVAFDPANSWLVLPCKNVGMKNLRDQLVMYRWNLRESVSPRLSMLTIPLAQVIGPNGWKSVRPTDITIDPATGNYVMIAQEKAVIEITPAGVLVRAVPLPGRHPQPEGVAITADSILIVGDEGTKRPATITLYRWPIGAAAGTSQ